jgi:hypothetical protein
MLTGISRISPVSSNQLDLTIRNARTAGGSYTSETIT